MAKPFEESFDLALEFAEWFSLHHPQITQISQIRQADEDSTSSKFAASV